MEEEGITLQSPPPLAAVKPRVRLRYDMSPPPPHVVYEQRKRKRRKGGRFWGWCCCCCGPCLGGCLRWMFLCASLCFVALLITTIYIRSRRSCCGESAELCLGLASIQASTYYEQVMSRYRGFSASVSKHMLQRAFDSCLSYGEIRVPLLDETSSDCYHRLIQCMDHFIDSRN